MTGVLFDLFGTVVAPFSKDRHDHALSLTAEALGLDPARCLSAWEADYDNRVRGRSGDIAAQLLAIADAQGVGVDRQLLGPVTDSYTAFERSSLRPLFNICTFSCLIGSTKPDGAIYAAAARALGIEPDRLLFVGDGSDDELAGAARAGLTPALVEAEMTDTYDPLRQPVDNWAGTRLRDLSDVLALVP